MSVNFWLRGRPAGWAVGFTLLALAWPLQPARAADASPKPASTSGPWWAIQSLHPITVPPGPAHPVDAFLRQRLDGAGLSPSPTADRATLIRRVAFDLLGLPPTPSEVQAFVADPAPDAYERLVDRFLASPRYGERWARHWMDAVHFAETHGHDQDRIRPHAWPYRDYLIASFNADKPYARFVQEQVAGDVLFPEDPAGVVAMGMLAAGPWDESSLRDIREDTLDRQIGRYLDRDDVVTTVMQTFTSTTVQCSRCHDHKFDPISQRDYYALQAVFAGIDRGNRTYDADPGVHRRRRAAEQQLAAVKRADPAVLGSDVSQAKVGAWERARRAEGPESARPGWETFVPAVFLSAAGATLTRQADGSLLAGGQHGPTDTYTLTGIPPSTGATSGLTGLRLELLPDDSLPHRGPGREPNGNLHLSEIIVQVFPAGARAPRRIAIGKATADYNQPDWTVQHALDGNDRTAWGIYPQVGREHQAVFEFKSPEVLAAGDQVVVILKQLHGGHCIGRFRLSVTTAKNPAGLRALPPAVRGALQVPAEQRTAAQRLELAAHVLREDAEQTLARLPAPGQVYAGASDFLPDGSHKPAGGPRPVSVLRRGEITRPVEPAAPGTLSCVAGLPARFALADDRDEGARRMALARWLTDRENPLTWRSIVNRTWHQHFGRGLVETVNDFGRMGGAPSHPELLDWLAVWFRDDARGSLKALHRLLVTSAAYRQVAAAGPLPPGHPDPDNRLLWRMNRARLDAEQIRDAILQASGALDLRMGGPSEQEFGLQPGIHVTPRVDYTQFKPGAETGRRRGVYRFLFRTLPDPFMDALDCPAGDQLTPVRYAGVTVQQALALWNNAFIEEQARRLARNLADAGGAPEQQVTRMFELVLGRGPQRGELAAFADHSREHGLAAGCRVLFNSNEFMFVN